MDKNKLKTVLIILFIVFVVAFNKFFNKSNKEVEENFINFVVLLDGEVNVPGEYNYSNPVTLMKVIEDAKGLTEYSDVSSIDLYKEINENLNITIPKIKEEIIKVEIKGEVVSPGIYELVKGSRVNDLVILSGGFTKLASNDINLAKLLKDGESIEVKQIKEIDNDKIQKPIVKPSVNTGNKDIVNESKVELKNVIVEIKGEVINPGVYTLKEGSLVNDLVKLAGGVTKRAFTDNINFAQVLKNEQLIVISKIIYNESNKININTATKKELESLPGIGESISENIIKYRKIKQFTNIEELKSVERVSDSLYEKVKELITV